MEAPTAILKKERKQDPNVRRGSKFLLDIVELFQRIFKDEKFFIKLNGEVLPVF